MKSRKRYYFAAIGIIVLIVVIKYVISSQNIRLITDNTAFERDDEWDNVINGAINSEKIVLKIDGKNIDISEEDVYFDEDMIPHINLKVLRHHLLCAVNTYPDGKILIEKRNTKLEIYDSEHIVKVDGKIMPEVSPITYVGGAPFISAELINKYLDYEYEWDAMNNTICLADTHADKKVYPYMYDYRTMGKAPLIKNQGKFGTCWAFSAMTALESSVLPGCSADYSEDHMTYHNGYSSDIMGGYVHLALAYLTAWKGPVLEAEDPYGDGKSPDDLYPVMHVQEVQIIENKNIEEIKKAVFLYGGVQTSIYMLQDRPSNEASEYYNPETASYCYIGIEKPNHAVAIIGWDDNYKADNFSTVPIGDGAFICANSWGENYGDKGYFYVSYYDSNIGTNNVVYTCVQGTDNYDNIYQSDLTGQAGQIGYKRDNGYFANVYEAKSDEKLRAVGFYSLGTGSQYEVYFIDNYKDTDSFQNKTLVAKGLLNNAGYYTIDIKGDFFLKKGQKSAVMVFIKTPSVKSPIAMECKMDDDNDGFILEDGEGYISYNGNIWEHTEEKFKCNICLKMYTDNRK